jgi:hypothetical protein
MKSIYKNILIITFLALLATNTNSQKKEQEALDKSVHELKNTINQKKLAAEKNLKSTENFKDINAALSKAVSSAVNLKKQEKQAVSSAVPSKKQEKH